MKLKDAEKLLENLKEKSMFVSWNNADRKEYFGIIAKNIERKKELRNSGFVAFDLDDFRDFFTPARNSSRSSPRSPVSS